MQVDFGANAPLPPTQFAHHVFADFCAFVAELFIGFEQAADVDGVAERFLQHGGMVALALFGPGGSRCAAQLHPRGVVATQGLHRANGCGEVLALLLFLLLGTGAFARLCLRAPGLQLGSDVAQVLQGLGACWAWHVAGEWEDGLWGHYSQIAAPKWTA